MLGLLFTASPGGPSSSTSGPRCGSEPGLRVFFLAQIGKYVPGSVWVFVAQMELGRSLGVPRRSSGLVRARLRRLHCATGLLIAAVTLPIADPEVARRYWWLLVVAPVMLLASIRGCSRRC